MKDPSNVFDATGEKVGTFFFGPAQNGSIKFQTRNPSPEYIQVTFVLSRHAAHLEHSLSGIFLEIDFVILATWKEHAKPNKGTSCLVATLFVKRRRRKPQEIIDALAEQTQKRLFKAPQATPP